MAFDKANLHLIYAGNDTKWWMYSSTGDNLGTIISSTATAYFSGSTGDSLSQPGSTKIALAVNDVMYIQASDVRAMCFVSSISGSNGTSVTMGFLWAKGEVAASTAIRPYGLVHSTAAAGSTITVEMPYTAGQEITIKTTVSTALTVTFSSTTAGVLDSTGVSILLNAVNQCVTLIAESTSKWLIKSIGKQTGTEILGPVMS